MKRSTMILIIETATAMWANDSSDTRDLYDVVLEAIESQGMVPPRVETFKIVGGSLERLQLHQWESE